VTPRSPTTRLGSSRYFGNGKRKRRLHRAGVFTYCQSEHSALRQDAGEPEPILPHKLPREPMVMRSPVSMLITGRRRSVFAVRFFRKGEIVRCVARFSKLGR